MRGLRGRTLQVRDNVMGATGGSCIELNGRSNVIIVKVQMMAGGVAKGAELRQQKQTITNIYGLKEQIVAPLRES